MAPPPMRPPVDLVVPLSPGEVVARLSHRLDQADCPCGGAVASRHVDLQVCQRDRHTWSPQLSVEVEAHAEGARIRGRFGPHPHVWTLFVAMYAVLVFGGIAALMLGWSQWLAGQAAWALWGLPVVVVLAGAVYAAALVGQRLGADQMDTLVQFIDEAVREGEGSARPSGAAAAPGDPAA